MMMGMGMGMNMDPEMIKKMQEKVAERKAAAAQESSEAPAPAEAEPGKPQIDEKAVIDYILSRQAAVDEARREARTLKADVTHLESQLKIANTKVKALQDALAKLREEKKALEESLSNQG